MNSALCKCTALLLTCAILLVGLGACAKKDEGQAGVSEPPAVTPEAPTTDAAVSPPGTPSTAPDITPAGSADNSPKQPPEEIRAAEAEAVSLVTADIWTIDFMINLTMDGTPIYDDINPGPDYPVIVPEYKDINNLIRKLERIYISDDAYSPFFKYPIFSHPQVFSRESGQITTFVYPQYPGIFESRIDVDSIKITEFTADHAVFSFDIFNNEFFSSGSMSMTLSPDGWRLDESFYFNCLKRLNLLNINSATAWENNPLLDPDQNAGSAKRLTGECMFYNIFINDAESSWDDASLAGYYEMQGKAFQYLEEQAAMFGHELRFFATDAENALYFDVDTTVSGDPNDHFWFDRFLMDTDYKDVNGLLEALKVWADDPDYENYGLFINLNKQGRSYAIPHNVLYHTNGNYFAERIVLYYFPDNYPVYAMVSDTAARILWIYGALNMYYPNDGDTIRKETIMRFFPFEIMHNIPYLADVAMISAFTAFRVGWRDTLPGELMMFQAKG